MKVAHFISGKEKCPDPIYDDDYRSYLINRRMTPRDYRFCKNAVRARSSACAHGPAASTMIQIFDRKPHMVDHDFDPFTEMGGTFARPAQSWEFCPGS
jgi:hypothetical protein